MSKEKLINDFFNLGGNYKNLKEKNALKEEITKQLGESQDSDLQLLEILRLSKSFSESFEFNDFEEACKISSTTIERLKYKDTKNFDLYDIRIAMYLVSLTDTFEEAIALSIKSLTALKKYVEYELVYMIELWTNINLLLRLLRADYYEINAKEELERSKKLEEVFLERTEIILAICQSRNGELKSHELITLIRLAIFKRDFKLVDKHLKSLKDIGDKELYKVMKLSTIVYSINATTSITQQQFDSIVGSNLKKIKVLFKLTTADIAELLGYVESHITAIERGERSLSFHQAYNIAEKLELTVNDLCYNDLKIEKNKKENLELEKLKFLSSELDKDEIETLCIIAQRMIKQKRKLQKLQSYNGE